MIGEIPWRREDRLPALEAPTTVAAGDSFTVTVTTVGGGNCTRAAGARVAYDRRRQVAVITPRDSVLDVERMNRANRATLGPAAIILECEWAQQNPPRPVRLRFARPGWATVQVRGRWLPNAHWIRGNTDPDSVLITREVRVRVTAARE